ncbi:extracellular solute-binding protein [Peloplasma aerotolerans]|uniref:Extracellular solute-binding protein n=1 Tax=Peloplasma aerotolerans TaxID=3044389 RepID=A0AAW6U9E7_9MOLU|nr:extracellular solute-binding protein [Mariniplasma sp. M4Ah]MDI6452763.1 extracellular solute-binding protein [Mariniplasma sp. M4Ah]
MKKGIIFILLTMCIGLYILKLTPPVMANNQDWVFDLGQFRENTYYRTLNRWIETYNKYEDEPLTFSINDQEIYNNHLMFEDGIVSVQRYDQLVYYVQAPHTGLYQLELSFYIDNNFSTSPTVHININDDIPFNEMSGFALDVKWEMESREEHERYNRFGNELLPRTVPVKGWYRQTLSDTNGRFNDSFWFQFNEGINKISIEPVNQNLSFGDMTLHGAKPMVSYQDYFDMVSHHEHVSSILTLEGQSFTSKNDIEIKAGYFKGPNMSPTSYKINILNILDGQSMVRSGMTVDYEFNIETSGLYRINFKYLQRDMVGMSSARRIRINDEVPFQELDTYLFPYVKNWTNHTLGSDDGEFWFYFESGEHTISLEVTTAHLINYIDTLHNVMDQINSLGLAVSQITGNSTDVLIDWDILRYLPTIKEDLLSYADTLDMIYDEINQITPSSSRATGVSTLQIASKQLRRLAQNPNRIPNKISELNVGSGSSYQLIGIAINQMNVQPLHIDQIHLFGNDIELDKAHPNIWQRVIFSVQSFVYSFFDQRYRLTSNPNDDVLEVWIGQSSLYLDIMQNMIDDGFTKETGIPVRLSVLPNTQRIILNNATGTNPDVVLSIDSWEPYAYALRGMLADLRQFDGFAELVQPYHPNNFTPMIFEDGVYGVPETQGVSLMFYRKDILNFLGIEPPDTWDDVLGILPILQSYQMNFYHPLGGEGAYKGFGLTAPFIYQFGGDIYTENGMSTTFNEAKNIEAITFMTDIFNIYNLPQQVPNFFEHFRSGSLPIGVASVDLYLQLKYAAPELAGQWGVLPIPGVYDDTLGEVARWAPTYGKASILFEKSNMKDEGFQLIQWWNKVETQLTLLETVKMVLGERYLFLPANLDALEQSIWDDEVKVQSLLQAQWSRIPAVTPGSYIVERELTNIWNKIVIDQMNPRVAIDQSIPRINRELMRKYEEFGYYKGGVTVREYIVPRNDNIQNWIP